MVLCFGGSNKAEDAARMDELKKNANDTIVEHRMELDELYQKLNANPTTGHTEEFAQQRLHEDGKNKLTPPPSTPWYVKLFVELFSLFPSLLWAGGILCMIAFALRAELDNLYLGVVLFAVVVITGLFSFYQNQKSDNMMAAFKNLLPPQVKVKRVNKEGKSEIKEVEAENIVRGDIIVLVGGDAIPADIRIIQCSDDMAVDNASITGESLPIKRKAVTTDDDPLETKNLCFFGTQVPEGSCEGIVIQVGDNTFLGRIAALALGTDSKQTPINIEIEHFIHIISAIAIFLGVTFFLIGQFVVQAEPITNLVFVIGIIVANVPEGLLATVTVALTLTATKMVKKKVLVKNLEGVETLGSTSCICSDKTGTLTKNDMTVVQIVYGGPNGFETFDCRSSFTNGRETHDPSSAAFQRLQRCGTLCNKATFKPESKFDEDGKAKPFRMGVLQGDGTIIDEVVWKTVGNASEGAMIKFCHEFRDIEDYRATNPVVIEIPFNSKNKYQAHVHKLEDGSRAVLMKGAPERIIDRCTEAFINGEVVDFPEDAKNVVKKLQDHMSENGLRVLGFCERVLPTDKYPDNYEYISNMDDYETSNFPIGDFFEEKNREALVQADALDPSKLKPFHPNAKEGMVFLGLMALIDPPRDAVPGAVALCKTAGIKVIMVTGDHPKTAAAIAKSVGILWGDTREDIMRKNAEKARPDGSIGLMAGDPGYMDPDDAEAIVVPGPKISADMPQERWDEILMHPQIVFARTSPQQKLVIVENNQRLGHIVAVTGDGVNDSPALKKGDIGVAMGIAGSDVSKNAADMILLDDNFASIVSGVEEGRLIFDNLKKSICYTLTSNIPEITPFLCFVTLSTPLPLPTILILAIDLGTDLVPAISMAYEEAEADIMKRPPRNSKVDRLVTKKLIFLAYLQIGIMQATAGFYTWLVVLNDYGYPPHILPGIDRGEMFGRQVLFCRFSGGQYVNKDGEIDPTRDPSEVPPSVEYPLWDRGDGGYIIDCEYSATNLIGPGGENCGTNCQEAESTEYFDVDNFEPTTGEAATGDARLNSLESMLALMADDYFPYIPWRGRMSPFWKNQWLYWDTDDLETLGGAYGGAEPITYFRFQLNGLYSIGLADPDFSQDGGSDILISDDALEAAESGTEAWQANQDTDPVVSWYRTLLGGQGANEQPIVDNYEHDQQYEDAVFCNGFPGATHPLTTACQTVYDNMELFMPAFCEDECSLACSLARTATDDIIGLQADGTPYRYGDDVSDAQVCMNIASRMTALEALRHSQGAFFVSIVVVQWADLLICKTRWLSIRSQGMKNSTLNFGLFFETALAAWLCYCLPIHVLGTRNLRLTHWFPGIPFSIMIFVYDETRKFLMRVTSPETVDAATGQVIRVKGWLERNTYY
uniref:Cation-transporting P-type ATPase N-terminal domain-containing protein n=1 Tax=Pinguiococcus pyrenoidosus TaxID=172671 RepID=A0A7R9U5E7_9STRA|mmetsp:Transcript_13474/g.50150  ORF Transcript_13474/g.50150 Transcript_13474/m.50150 type:complete len:1389 (+) Transcript_13474:197-4363(+)